MPAALRPRGTRAVLFAAAVLLVASCGSDAGDGVVTDDGFADDGFRDDEFTDDGFGDGEFTDDGFADDEFGDDGFRDDGLSANGDSTGGAVPSDGVPTDDQPVGQVVGGGSGQGGVGPASGVPADELGALLDELEAAGFCDPADVENDGTVTAMHFVADGQIQPPCYTEDGADDPRLLDAWSIITDIAPVELYDDVSLVAGYDGSSDTLAFVTTLDETASFFLMAVDVGAGERDRDELRLTMMHELTHVFAQHPGTQLDVSTEDASSCATLFNGNGCFRDGAYIDEWIEAFWTSEMLAELPDDGAPLDDAASYELCRSEGGFTGAYAATHPEEDFAETFAAFVYGVELAPDLDAKLAFFEQYPEFVALRDAAAQQGLDGLPSPFDPCE